MKEDIAKKEDAMELEANQQIESFNASRIVHTTQQTILADSEDSGKLQIMKKIQCITDDAGFEGACIGEITITNSYDDYGNLVKTVNDSWDQFKQGGSSKSSHETIFENEYDEHGNMALRKSVDQYEEAQYIRWFRYDNQYDAQDRLVQVVVVMTTIKNGEILDDEYITTAIFEYSEEDTLQLEIVGVVEGDVAYNNLYRPMIRIPLAKAGRLCKQAITSNVGTDEVHIYHYDQAGMLLEEEVWINQERAYYYIYKAVTAKELQRTFANPGKGQYNWLLRIDSNYRDSCEIFLLDYDLHADMVKEIVEYVIKEFKGAMTFIIIDVLYINNAVNWEVYQYYWTEYGIRILENW